jgi:hypothetical protein
MSRDFHALAVYSAARPHSLVIQICLTLMVSSEPPRAARSLRMVSSSTLSAAASHSTINPRADTSTGRQAAVSAARCRSRSMSLSVAFAGGVTLTETKYVGMSTPERWLPYGGPPRL